MNTSHEGDDLGAAPRDQAAAPVAASAIRANGIAAGTEVAAQTANLTALTVSGWLLRVLLAAVFFYAGWSKLLRPDDFLQDILNYQLLGGQAALWVAVLLPPLELLLALCLLLRATALPAALLVGGLCTAFLLALVSAWGRGLDIACGCFGGSAPVSYPQTLLRDLILIACAAALALILARTQARTGR